MEKSNEQDIKNLDERINNVEMTARQGSVTTIDYDGRTVTVSWSDGTQSDPMKVLYNGTDWMPEIGDVAVSLHRPSGDGWVIGTL